MVLMFRLNKSLKDLLARHFNLCIVDEFKTSKMCSFCLEGETCYYKQRENPKPFREDMVNIHGLLTCIKCSKSSHSYLMNRDLNGSRNILYLMKEWIQNRTLSVKINVEDSTYGINMV